MIDNVPEILPCPFCGGEAHVHHTSPSDIDTGYNFHAMCRCSSCVATISVASKQDEYGWCQESPYAAKARSIIKWNKRHTGETP